MGKSQISAKEQRELNMKSVEFLSGEAEELHDFLSKEGIPEFTENEESVLPLIDRVLLLCMQK